MPLAIEFLKRDPEAVSDASADHVWLGADLAVDRIWLVNEAGEIIYALTTADGATYEPLLNLAANEFRARASTGFAENKPITDAALALLADASVPRLGTSNIWTNDQILNANVTLGGSSADSLTLNAGVVTLASNYTATRAIGVAPSGTTIASHYPTTFTGAVDGTSDVRSAITYTSVGGANSVAQVIARNARIDIGATAGVVARAVLEETFIRLGLSGAGGASLTTLDIHHSHVANEGPANITNACIYKAGNVDLLDGTGLIGTLAAFRAEDQGHATRISTEAIGYTGDDFTAGAPLTATFRSKMTSGAGKWGIYNSGNANNAFAGPTRFGGITVPTAPVDVTGNIIATTTIAAGTGFLAPAGSTSATAVQGPSDPNTGPVYSAADQYDIVTGGSRAIRFDASQNALIGGVVSANRKATFDNQGRLSFDFYDNGSPINIRVNNYGITAAGQGNSLFESYFGVGGVAGARAFLLRLLTTEDYTSAANSSAELLIDLVADGTSNTAFRLDPKIGLKLFNSSNPLVTNQNHLRPAAGSSSSAPQQFTAGSITATAASGELGFNGNFYETPVGLARYVKGGTVAQFTTDSGNTTTVETTLRSYTAPGGALAVTGDGLRYKETISIANTVATKQIKVKFGPSGSETLIFDSGALAGSVASAATVDIDIIRVSSSIVACTVSATLAAAMSPTYTSVTGLTLANAQSLIITGQAGVGGATNDLIARHGRVEFKGGI